MHVGDDVPTVDGQRRVAREAKCRVQHGTVLGDVDVLAGEHRLDALRQPGLVREPHEQRQRLIGDAVLRVVEMETCGLGGQPLAARRVRGEEVTEVRVSQRSAMRLERSKGVARTQLGDHPRILDPRTRIVRAPGGGRAQAAGGSTSPDSSRRTRQSIDEAIRSSWVSTLSRSAFAAFSGTFEPRGELAELRVQVGIAAEWGIGLAGLRAAPVASAAATVLELGEARGELLDLVVAAGAQQVGDRPFTLAEVHVDPLDGHAQALELRFDRRWAISPLAA